MASVESQIQRLILNAEEIKTMTGWPYEMVEDYLNILTDLLLLASNIDINIDQLNRAEQNVALLSVQVGKLDSRITSNESDLKRAFSLISWLEVFIHSLKVRITSNTEYIKKVEQISVSW